MARGGRSKLRLCLIALALPALVVALGAAWPGRTQLSVLSAVAAPKPGNPANPATSSSLLRPVGAKGYEWWTGRDDKRIKIRGVVPSEEDRKTIHGMIKANMPDLEIDDKTEVADGAPPKQLWLGAVSFALVQISQLKAGAAWLRDTDFYIEGEARTAVTFAALKTAVTSQLPKGVELKNISVTPPMATPFVWMAQYESGVLTLAGHVPNDESRAELVKQASRIFSDKQIVDRMELAAGSPDNWVDAVAASLRQLARLESGKVNLTDTALAIEGVAETKDIAADVAATIKQGLPKSYDAKDSIRYRLS